MSNQVKKGQVWSFKRDFTRYVHERHGIKDLQAQILTNPDSNDAVTCKVIHKHPKCISAWKLGETHCWNMFDFPNRWSLIDEG